ncbi:sensor histidine kinase [Desulfuribacillus alkaliarsenatis]|uniref:histidine kinase n=1 Tax=Desulfuribacillus alkaliarsenatis TaxID=766136 RepID=A0A1E5FZT7_9FIRM|nr:ATP-binding protein [Desulfuribacillus alkaliarsenatis]OEF96091.1 hypothetical protein BHF68_10165 [Desulfuribacillus alkaliarsenatis]
MKGLAPKITLAFLFAIIVTLLLYSLILNQSIDDQFNEYIQANLLANNEKIANALGQAYMMDGRWTPTTGLDISSFVILDGISLRVRDLNNFVVWNSINIHPDITTLFLLQSEQSTTTVAYPISVNRDVVGYVDITYLGDIPLGDIEEGFKSSINKSLISTAIFATIFAIFLSVIFSSGITLPLTKMTNIATELRKGDLRQRMSVGTSNDEISELAIAINHLAETLEKEEKLRKNITADIAHELRTPLMTLQGQLEAMIDEIIDPTPETISSCQEEVIRLSSLIQDLEQLTTAESASFELNKEVLSLTDIARTVVDSFETQAKQKDMSLSFYASKKSYIDADKGKLTQILINLVSNAIKYSRPKDKVTVKISQSDGIVQLKVSDTGLGISEDDLPYIFERFYRGDKSRNRDTGGSGIGLAIVKSLVEAHNWQISVESALQKGTTFTLKMPAYKIYNQNA